MNPEQKAKDIVEKMWMAATLVRPDDARVLAKVAINEILESVNDFAYSDTMWDNPITRKVEGYQEASEYWQEVKKELDKS